jgi:hypothetical protein
MAVFFIVEFTQKKNRQHYTGGNSRNSLRTCDHLSFDVARPRKPDGHQDGLLVGVVNVMARPLAAGTQKCLVGLLLKMKASSVFK